MKTHPKFPTYEACELAAGLTPGMLPTVSHLPEEFRTPTTGNFQAMVVAKAFNEGWIPNFNDLNEPKYMVCPRIEANEEHPSGFGFLLSYCDTWRANADCGSRTLFKSSELAICALEQFPEIFKDYILFKR